MGRERAAEADAGVEKILAASLRLELLQQPLRARKLAPQLRGCILVPARKVLQKQTRRVRGGSGRRVELDVA